MPPAPAPLLAMQEPPDEADSGGLDLASLLLVLRAGLWWILGAVGLGLLLGWFYVWISTPIYLSDALVQVEDSSNGRSVNMALGDMAEALGPKAPTVAEIRILRSRMVIGKVVQDLHFDILAEPHYFPLVGRAFARGQAGGGRPAAAPLGLDSYAWGGERLQVTTLDLPAALVNRPLGLVAGPAGSFGIYDRKTRLGGGRVGQLTRLPLASGGRLVIFVNTLVARPGTRFDLVKLSPSRSIARVAGFLVVSEQSKQSGMIDLNYQHASPETAQRVLNQILDTYQRQNVERRSADAAQTLAFLQQQLPQIKLKVEEAENNLKNYQVRQGSSDLPEETSQLLRQEVSLATLRLDLEQKKQAALRTFTENHPTIRAIDDQLAKVQGELGRVEGLARNVPETQKELLRLKRDLEVNTALYTSLLNSYQELQVAKAGTIGNARIIDYAMLPTEPIRPNRNQILGLAMLLGLAAGIALVFVRQALHRGIEDPAVVERALGLPTYAAIPYVRSQDQLTSRFRRRRETIPIMAVLDPGSVAIESLRSLRTSLHFAMLEAENNIIMLTGPAPGLGKSFTSINLGAVLAMSGNSVVLVDGDMRRGYLHEYVSQERTPGLSEYIAGQADLDGILRPTAAAGLQLVTTGKIPPNPAELLLHPRFKALLDELSARFDYVLIDSAPVLAVTDAGIIGTLAGTTMMVLKAGEHDLRTIEESVRRLRQTGSNVRGTIFNQMGRNATAYKQAAQYGYKYDYRAAK